jgi:hypothetical protein
MSFRKKNNLRDIHVCLARLNISTCDQIEIIGTHLSEIGVDYCFLGFEANSFSMNTVDFEHHNDSITCNNREDLERTYATHDSRMLILQSPYPEHYPDWIMDCDDKVEFAFAGYALPLIDWINGHFQTPIIVRAKYLLAASEYEYSGYTKYGRRDAEVHLVGNSIMFELRRNLSKKVYIKPITNKMTLWAPHWSTSWIENTTGFNRFEEILPGMLDYFEENKNQKLIFRPHPILREALLAFPDALVSREAQTVKNYSKNTNTKNLLQKLLSLENVQLSNSNLTQDISSTDQLVTDGVSVISYWAATGKPMCLIRDQNTPKLSLDGEYLIKKMHKASNFEELRTWLSYNTSIKRMTKRRSERVHPTFTRTPIEEFLIRVF